MPDAAGGLFTAAGFTLPQGMPQAAPGNSAPVGTLFKDAGFVLPTKAAPIPTPSPAVRMLGNRPLEDWEVTPGAANPNAAPAGRVLQGVLPNPLDYIPDPNKIFTGLVKDFGQSTAANFQGARATAASGVQDVKSGNYLPSFPTIDPRTWTAGGPLKVAAGTLGMVASPASGLLDAAVAHPVTELTGNPAIGQDVANVAGLMLGAPKAATAAKSVPETRAINALVEAVGPENVPAAVARLQSNPRLALMDVSDPVRTLAQGLIDPAQPKAQNILSSAVKGRIASAPDAVNAAYTQAMGAAPDVVKVVNDLKQKAQDVGTQMIQPAIKSAGPVDITPVIDSLDKTIGPYALKALQAGETPKLPMTSAQQTAWDLRQRLRGALPDHDPNGPYTRNMFLDAPQAHEIQSQMRYEASQLASSGVGSERLTAGRIGDVRGQLVNAIDAAANGAYKPALAKYRDAMTVQEAFESGFDTLKNRSGVAGLEDRPEAFQQWMANASPEEIAARQLGTRADIDQKINGMRFAARQGSNVPDVEYNQQKLAMLFGPKQAATIIQKMNDIRDEAVTNSKLLANSKTAETLAGQRALTVPNVEPLKIGSMTSALLPSVVGEGIAQYMGLEPGLAGAGMLAGGTAIGAAKKLTQNLARSNALARNVAIARGASASGPARTALMSLLMNHPAVTRAVRQATP